MSSPAPTLGLDALIAATVEAAVRRAVEPLRLELERLRGEKTEALVTLPEAARILGRSVRTVERQAKRGALEVEVVGGVRLVRLPAGLGPR